VIHSPPGQSAPVSELLGAGSRTALDPHDTRNEHISHHDSLESLKTLPSTVPESPSLLLPSSWQHWAYPSQPPLQPLPPSVVERSQHSGILERTLSDPLPAQEKVRNDSTLAFITPAGQHVEASKSLAFLHGGAGRAPVNAVSYMIRPPDPPTSNKALDPSSLITPVLAMLADKLDLITRFQPSFQHRTLRETERGYWRISTRDWSPETKEYFWSFLTDLVGSGRAGWNVWCSRSNLPCQEEHANSKMTEDEEEMIKIYCWGIVVPHVYLIIFLASKREIKRQKIHWLDGSESVILEMH